MNLEVIRAKFEATNPPDESIIYDEKAGEYKGCSPHNKE